MIDWLKTMLENQLNWIEILLSLVVNIIFIGALVISIRKWIRRKVLFRVNKKKKDLCALSIGIGKNNPYQATKDFLGQSNEHKIIEYWKHHTPDAEKDMTAAEVQDALKEIESIIDDLRRKNVKEVLVFFAGPLSGAFKIGYLFKNYFGVVKFMQLDRSTNRYTVMTTLTN